MSKRNWNKPTFWLSMKTAKALIKQELGVSGTGLRVLETGAGVHIYELLLGRLAVVVENDWSERNGLIRMWFGFDSSGVINKYYDPETLEEDYEAGAENRAEIRAEMCDVCTYKQEGRK